MDLHQTWRMSIDQGANGFRCGVLLGEARTAGSNDEIEILGIITPSLYRILDPRDIVGDDAWLFHIPGLVADILKCFGEKRACFI